MIILFLFFPLISSFLSSPFGMNKFFPFLGQIVHGHPPPLSGSSIMFSLSAFLAIFPLAGSFLSLSLISEPFWPSVPLLGRFFSLFHKWSTSIYFYARIVSHSLCKKKILLIWFSPLFPQTNTFYCTFVFSASLAQTFVPCWVKVQFFSLSPIRLIHFGFSSP